MCHCSVVKDDLCDKYMYFFLAKLKHQGGFYPLLPRKAQTPGWFLSFATAQSPNTRVVFTFCYRAKLKHQGGFRVLLPRKAQTPGWFSRVATAQSPNTRVVFAFCKIAKAIRDVSLCRRQLFVGQSCPSRTLRGRRFGFPCRRRAECGCGVSCRRGR